MSNETVTCPIFYCTFNSDESITHFMNDVSEETALIESLPHYYGICLADNGYKPRKIVAGFVVKTNLSHEDVDFKETMLDVIQAIPELKNIKIKELSLLPAKMSVPSGPPLTESEMLQAMSMQYLKFATKGSA